MWPVWRQRTRHIRLESRCPMLPDTTNSNDDEDDMSNGYTVKSLDTELGGISRICVLNISGQTPSHFMYTYHVPRTLFKHRQNKHVAHCRISIHVRFDICQDRNIISWSESFYTNRCVQFRAIKGLILNKNCYTEKWRVVYWFKILMIVMFFNF